MKIVPVGEGHIRIETDKGMEFDVYSLVGGGLKIDALKNKKLLVEVLEDSVVIRIEEIKG